MTTKRYRVNFYTINSNNGNTNSSIHNFLTDQIKDGKKILPPVDINSGRYQVRNLDIINGLIIGSLTKLRSDLPSVGEEDSHQEEKLVLKNDRQKLLEKSHFSILKINDDEILSFQRSNEAGFANTLAKILSLQLPDNITIAFDDIFTRDAMQKLLHGDVVRFDYTIKKPKEKNIEADDFSISVLDTMTNTGATWFQGSLSTRSKGKALYEETKKIIKGLVKSETTTRINVKLNGIEEPIDLLGQRFTKTISVPVDGKYPDTGSMLTAIVSKTLQVQNEIEECIYY